jgi:putative ABC transport system substrate-binding protein
MILGDVLRRRGYVLFGITAYNETMPLFAHRSRALLGALAAAALAVLAAIGAPPATHAADDVEGVPFVGVTAIVRDASIDALYTGMTDALRDAGYRDGETVRLRFDSADADAGRAARLIKSFTTERADVIVAFTDPSARIAAGERLRTPLVIAGVGPETASDLRRGRTAKLLTGIVEEDRFDTQLALIRDIAPTARTVAIAVNADQPVDKAILRQVMGFARGLNLAIEQLPVSVEKGLIAAAIESYTAAETVILLDSRIFPDAPVDRIIAAAETARLLVFSNDEDSVVRGALAAIVTEPYGTGRQIGQLVARILEKPSAARTPLQAAIPSYIVINRDTATRIGIEIPPAVLARRGRVIGWAETGGPRPRDKPVVPNPAPAAAAEPEAEPEAPEPEAPEPEAPDPRQNRNRQNPKRPATGKKVPSPAPRARATSRPSPIRPPPPRPYRKRPYRRRPNRKRPNRKWRNRKWPTKRKRSATWRMVRNRKHPTSLRLCLERHSNNPLP